MLSPPMRSLILAVPFILLATLLSAPATRASALALPASFPMPFRNADYNGHLASFPHTTQHEAERKNAAMFTKHTADGRVNASSVRRGYYMGTYHQSPRALRRDVSQLDSMLDILGDAKANSLELQNMASQSASQDENDPTFQQNAASRLSSFKSNTEAFNDILGQLSADKGLANYDKNDALETMLRDFVNFNKDVMSSVTTMTYNIPALGPILGPIVYDIKCIIDQVLDATENITDGLLNALKPLLPGIGL